MQWSDGFGPPAPDEIPETHAGTLRVCGTLYKCQAGAWHRADPDVHTDASSTCTLDGLLGVAAARGCNASVDAIQLSDDARRALAPVRGKVQPCYDAPDDRVRCLVRAKGMPDVVDGEMRFAAMVPNARTHERVGIEHHGEQLDFHVFQPGAARPQPPADAAVATPPPVPPAPSPTADVAVASTAVATPPRAFTPTAPPPSKRTNDLGSEAPPTASAPDDAQTEAAAWRKCEWFADEAPRTSCVIAERDCPAQTRAAQLDAWYDFVVQGGCRRQRAGPLPTIRSVHEMVKESQKCAPCTGTRKLVRTHATDLRADVRALFNADASFQKYVTDVATRHKDIRHAVRETMATACVDGQCTDSPDTPPRTRIYDGTEEVRFHVTEDGVHITRNGGVQTRAAVASCAGPRPPTACTRASLPTVRNGVLTPGRDDPADAYALTLDRKRYVFWNDVHTDVVDDASARQQCARTLCALNARECPAPYCARDADGSCTAATPASVQLPHAV